jgi:hypothetical protein
MLNVSGPVWAMAFPGLEVFLQAPASVGVIDATIWASASLEAVLRPALEATTSPVIPPAILEKKVEVRETRCRLNAKIALRPLDDVRRQRGCRERVQRGESISP